MQSLLPRAHRQLIGSARDHEAPVGMAAEHDIRKVFQADQIDHIQEVRALAQTGQCGREDLMAILLRR